MLKIRQIDARLHVHATESISKVRDALKILFPFDLRPQELEITNMTGSFGNPIYALTVILHTNALILQSIESLAKGLLVLDKQQLTLELENRLDEKMNWYFRISKQYLVLGQIRLAFDTKDVIQIKISIQNRNPRLKIDTKTIQGFLENMHLIAPKDVH